MQFVSLLIVVKLCETLFFHCNCMFFTDIYEGRENKLLKVSIVLVNILHYFIRGLLVICKFFDAQYLTSEINVMCPIWFLDLIFCSFLNRCQLLTKNTQVYLTLYAVILYFPP